MDTLQAFAMGKAHRHDDLRVFDWVKAAHFIKDRRVKFAEAGLSEDWEYTGGTIYDSGVPVKQEDTYVYLSSTWATPVLRVDDEDIECYYIIPNEEMYGVENDYWPQKALDILNS